MNNMRLENVSFQELRYLKCGEDAKKRPVYGIKRHVNLQLNKLNSSIEKNSWVFPLFVGELPDGDKYLIDGYARWEAQDKKKTFGGFTYVKYPAIIIQVKDLDQIKEFYLQCHSCYGTPTWEDFRNFGSKEGEVNYELPGLAHPNFDLSIMTREEVAKACLDKKYQII